MWLEKKRERTTIMLTVMKVKRCMLLRCLFAKCDANKMSVSDHAAGYACTSGCGLYRTCLIH